MSRLLFSRLALWCVATQVVAFGFVSPQQHTATTPASYKAQSALHAKTTLTDETNWKLRFVLNGVPTEKGKRVDEIFSVEVNFLEDEGYEPPQGSLSQVIPEGEENNSRLLKVTKSRWQLSEDPDDRKDGLWIWGLFSEPLYPFLLLSVETARIPIPGEEGDFIMPLKLFAQINHQRDQEKGVVLDVAELKIREMEVIKADPFGAATVEIFEEVTIGKLNILAL
jgi:hypothetical protein